MPLFKMTRRGLLTGAALPAAWAMSHPANAAFYAGARRGVKVTRPSVAAAAAYDFLIASDADWNAIPSGLLSGGGIVAVAPGTYTAPSITASPSSLLKFVAQDAGNKPIIDRLTLNGCGNIWLSGLRLVSTHWQASPSPCVLMTGTTTGTILIDGGCAFQGNYRGSLTLTYDPTTELPEMNGVYGWVSGGALTFSTTSAHSGNDGRSSTYVGDLLSDGTHPCTIIAAGGTGATVSVVVSGGVITGLTNQAGGSGYTNSSSSVNLETQTVRLHNGTSTLSALIDLMPYAIKSSAHVNNSIIIVQDCTFDFVQSALKFEPPRAGSGGSISILRNTFDRIYGDISSLGLNGATTGNPVIARGNFVQRPFAKKSDMGDPHGDNFQMFGDDIGTAPNITDTDWSGVEFTGNILMLGAARGEIQGGFMSDMPTGVYYNQPRICGNLILNKGNKGFEITDVRDAFVYRNTVALYDTSLASAVAQISLGIFQSAGHSYVGYNIAEGYSLAAGTTDQDSNVTLTAANSTDYNAKFSSPASAPTTKAAVLSAFAPESGFSGNGAVGGTYVNWTTGEVDETQEPSFIKWDSLTNQALSTQVSSEWSALLGGPAAGRSVSISGGEYRVADDAAGTNAGAWGSSSATVARGKYIQARHTTSGSGSTVTTTTLTVNSQAFTFQSTTTSAAFLAADNQGTAYSRIASTINSDTGVKKIVLAMRFKPDSHATNANMVAVDAAGTLRFWTPTTGAYRFTTVASNRAQLRPTLVPGTSAITHFITLDFTNTNAGQGCNWATDVDGMVLTNSAGTGGTFDTRSVAGSGTDYGAYAGAAVASAVLSGNLGIFAEGDGGGVFFDGRFEFFLMDWGDGTYTLPDISNSSVRAQLTRDNIGNGSGFLGHQAKLCYYDDSLTTWNDGTNGLANRGSIASKPLVKQAGTYA